MTELPKTLYHYTKQEGLLGIINGKKIWATDILYLNDATEFEYSVNLLKNMIDLYLKSNQYPESISSLPSNSQDEKFFKLMLKSFPAPEDKIVPNLYGNPNLLLDRTLKSFLELIDYMDEFRIFVFSLSEQEDSLSQWRGYCQNSNGFCLGFDTSRLKRTFSTSYNRFDFIECIYDTMEQEAKIKDFIDELIKDLKVKALELDDIKKAKNDVFTEYWNKFIKIAVQYKNESFEGEREWRIVSPPLSTERAPIKFRVGKTMIIPYIEILLSKESESYPLDKVIIGPTPHKELSKKSVEFLLSTNDIELCKVVNSKIPYRPL